jgi:nicotinate-nucleotide adenylyltransferase
MEYLKNKKIALYGGSFNPIHIGHLLTGIEVAEKLNYDYIIFIPDNIPVHKEYSDMASGHDRLRMAELSIKGIENFIISDIEIKRGGYSYTYETVMEMKEILKYEGKFGIIFGDDLLDGLPDWKNFDKLKEMTDLICLKRKNELSINIEGISYIKNRVIEISSSEIRKRISCNKTIDFMVTENVKNYIYENGLYRI